MALDRPWAPRLQGALQNWVSFLRDHAGNLAVSILVQAVGVSHLGGCAKLQCLVQGQCVGSLRAHRALDDCVCLRTVVERVAESYGVRAIDLLRPLVVRLDAVASAAQVSTL